MTKCRRLSKYRQEDEGIKHEMKTGRMAGKDRQVGKQAVRKEARKAENDERWGGGVRSEV